MSVLTVSLSTRFHKIRDSEQRSLQLLLVHSIRCISIWATGHAIRRMRCPTYCCTFFNMRDLICTRYHRHDSGNSFFVRTSSLLHISHPAILDLSPSYSSSSTWLCVGNTNCRNNQVATVFEQIHLGHHRHQTKDFRILGKRTPSTKHMNATTRYRRSINPKRKQVQNTAVRFLTLRRRAVSRNPLRCTATRGWACSPRLQP